MTAAIDPRGWLLLVLIAGCSHPATKAEPPKRLFHIRNTHFVTAEDFAADMRSQLKESVSDDTLNGWYDTFLDDVESLQDEQTAMLRDLIHEHGVQAVFLEGVTDDNVEAFREKVRQLKKSRRRRNGTPAGRVEGRSHGRIESTGSERAPG
jgi:hypothetical protein